MSAYNNTSILKKITYEIDGIELHIEDVITTELYWWKDRFSISGNITLRDNTDSANFIQYSSDNELQMYAVDGFDDFYFRNFVFADLADIKVQKKHKTMKYNIVDRLSYAMFNTHQSKSYAGVLLSDIVLDFFGYFGWEGLLDPNVALEILPTEKLHEFIIVPQDRNFLEWLMQQMHKEGYTMYQTRKMVRIGVKKDDVVPVALPKIEWDSFSELHSIVEHPFKIHETKTIFNPDLKQATQNPLQDTTHFDFATKTMISTKSSFADVFADYKLGTSALGNIQKGVGEKLGTQTNDMIPTIKSGMQDGLQGNTKLDILVVGNFLYNAIYMNADIVLAGSLENLQGQKEGDIRMSGVYTIVRVTDKYMPGKLVQKLSLERANFQEV